MNENQTSTNLKILDEREVLGNQFKIYGTLENPLFLAKDVAILIEHNKPSEMVANVDDDEKIKIKSYHGDNNDKVFQANTEYWFLSENGLYEVLMQSRKPKAKEFKKKVKEILKDIRKHGAYITDKKLDEIVDDPDSLLVLVEKLKDEKEKRLLLESQIKEVEPKLECYEAFLNENNYYNMNEVIKMLNLHFGRSRFFSFLREQNILMKSYEEWNVPYQRYSQYFKVIYHYMTKNGYFIKRVQVNAHGIDFLYKYMKRIGIYDSPEQKMYEKRTNTSSIVELLKGQVA